MGVDRRTALDLLRSGSHCTAVQDVLVARRGSAQQQQQQKEEEERAAAAEEEELADANSEECPRRFASDPPPHGSGALVGKLPGVEGWVTSASALAELEAWQRALKRPLPEHECDFESLPFSHGKDWATLVVELVRSGRPFRLTGLGTHLSPSSLSFASAAALLKGPFSDVKFEVGDIPYAADLRGGTFACKQWPAESMHD